jgi:hypothetical protein
MIGTETVEKYVIDMLGSIQFGVGPKVFEVIKQEIYN